MPRRSSKSSSYRTKILMRQQRNALETSRNAFGSTIRVYPDSCQDSHSLLAKSSHPLHLSAASCLLLEYHRASARAIDQIPSKIALVRRPRQVKNCREIMYLCVLVPEERLDLV